MSRKNVSDMYQLWFERKIPKDVYHAMKDFAFSQADIGKMFSCGDFDRIHAALVASPFPFSQKNTNQVVQST